MGQWKTLIKEVVWVSILALVLACSAYALRPHALPIMSLDEAAAITDDVDGQVVYINLEDAIRHFEQGTAIFADARPLQAFDAGHIRGARHLAPQDFDIWSSQVFSEIGVDEMIISYCDGVQCSLSRELADKFAWLGYENVVVLKDGWNRWRSRHMPVNTPADQ